ncbi:putative metal-binding protein [Clostridium tetanomorphum]|uniref:CGGC domain-containing protein n=1 Tax=Clostridium tetanomorphum TaxID=1553 RepID=A0A923ECV4_CLOTT|nr:CGGC domain-containing protein [Clostridium tetanomorphum]KAJ48867.1 CGGC domain-containing protein [Clostridium tetanomorphum DSM 665]KAJ52957.1 CGGC domain-containing protein [Clostridium tetanomorphum DSM 665]MBC2398210.1 CGGC domain-containing protein [Clostridium tetanomorphum]MBP1864897.1 putative metal-binding protein [Clostridium tetanomorphum]NRS83103.1 putative metal-binding protein [Clostridium tetanomorphum]
MAIAIMACRKLIGKCSGTGCFKAYNNCKVAFEIYKDKKPLLASFFYCSGCKETKGTDEDWEHKITQLKSNNVDTIHLALCINVECDEYEKHEEILKNEGFKIVRGSH